MPALTTISLVSVLPGLGLGPIEQDYVVTSASSVSGLTALAGGGQAGATPITAKLTRFTTVATAADSCLLPPAAAGLSGIIIMNSGAAALAVFPNGATDTINALAVQTAFSIPAGGRAEFFVPVTGKWGVLLSA